MCNGRRIWRKLNGCLYAKHAVILIWMIEWKVAYSVLEGIIKGLCSYLNIEQDDISGCLRYFTIMILMKVIII